MQRHKQFCDLAQKCCIPTIEGLGQDEVVQKMEEAHDKLLRVLVDTTPRHLMAILAAASYTLKIISQDWGDQIEHYIHNLPLYPRKSSLQSLREQELFLAWGEFTATGPIDD